MRRIFRDFGMFLSAVFSLAGLYLLGKPLAGAGNGTTSVILGSTLFSLALVMTYTSIRLHLKHRTWERHTRHD
jgi:hypothetical protein